jgi:hypothetical protein
MQRMHESDLVYFLHIPKTSGTSVRESILRVYGEDAASPNLLWDDLVNETSAVLPQHRIITGHLGGFFSLWLKRWPRIITMLREPIARALSHINHVQREPGHPLHKLSLGLSVAQYCEHPVLRRTVDNFQSRYLASLDFALALMPSSPESRDQEPYGSVSVRFENALYSLDKETGLLDGAIRALDVIDAVGICETHGASLRVFASVLGWDMEAVQFDLNQSIGQKTVGELSGEEIEVLKGLNVVDAQVYAHGVGRFSRLCHHYGIEWNERERSSLNRWMVPPAPDSLPLAS